MQIKLNGLWRILPLLLLVISFVACHDEEENVSDRADQINPLTFEKDSCNVRLGISSQLRAVSCNGYNVLQVEVGDTSILEAYVLILENSTSKANGSIRLLGKKKGSTTLKVYDRLAKETVVLEIKIVDAYLGMWIRGTNHPLFTRQNAGFLFLTDNLQKDFYLFGSAEQRPSGILQKGTYVFSVEGRTPYLTLSTEGEDALEVSYKFKLSGSKALVYELLNSIFHLEWDALIGKDTKDLDQTLYLLLEEEGTTHTVELAITDPEMPGGIF